MRKEPTKLYSLSPTKLIINMKKIKKPKMLTTVFLRDGILFFCHVFLYFPDCRDGVHIL